MCDVTVVCCYNNEKMYADLQDTLKKQNIPYELIGINNVDNKNFTSCSAAYNSVIGSVKTKYVVYSHQDIILTEPDNLEKFVQYLAKTATNDILGVAGVKFEARGVYTDLKQTFKATGKLHMPESFVLRAVLWSATRSMNAFLAAIQNISARIRLMKLFVMTGIYMLWNSACALNQQFT